MTRRCGTVGIADIGACCLSRGRIRRNIATISMHATDTARKD